MGVIIKVAHGDELYRFAEWLLEWLQEPSQEHGKGVTWQRYRGEVADVFELWGNEKLVTFAKLKWG